MPRLDARYWLPVAAVCVPAAAHATQYLTVEQAQHAIFPRADRFGEADLHLSPEDRKRIGASAGVGMPRNEPRVWQALGGDAPLGFFFVDEVIGKHELITYAVGIGVDGAVRGVEILDYRESRGGEVRDPRWRAQFSGKHASDPLRVGEDIQNITGATLSSRHITEGVRRLLALHKLVLAKR
jgi:hypothetical protein